MGFFTAAVEPVRQALFNNFIYDPLNSRRSKFLFSLPSELWFGNVTLSPAIRPSCTSSLEARSFPAFANLANFFEPASKTSFTARVIALSSPARCVPPSEVGMVLTKETILLSYPSTQRKATSTVHSLSTMVIFPSTGTFSSKLSIPLILMMSETGGL